MKIFPIAKNEQAALTSLPTLGLILWCSSCA